MMNIMMLCIIHYINNLRGFAKYVLSGGLIFGSLATAFWVTHMEDTPSYTDRKITNYSRS
jgi:hypothetical protein